MINVLFVDDDAIARKGIRVRIPWEQYGWTLQFCARDGMEALDFMKKERPDVVITDIKMPVMDGIQLASLAKEYYPDIRFIFISGYKEFEYARAAVKLNAVDYLSKPIMPDQLIDVMTKAEALIRKDEVIHRVVNENYPEMKRHYISQLMAQNFTNIDDQVFRTFDINLNAGFGCVGFIDYVWDGGIGPVSAMEVLSQGCQEFSSKFPGSFFLPLDDTQIFFIYTASETHSKAEFFHSQEALSCFVDQWTYERLQVRGNFYFGTPFDKLNQLYLSYQAAVRDRNLKTSDLMLQVRMYLNQNYSDPTLKLNDIAREFGINHCYLTSQYKERFGINLYDDLIQIRMQKAAELLRTTTLKGYEIAEKVGYNNSQYFSLSFRKYYGCTVTEFKNKG